MTFRSLPPVVPVGTAASPPPFCCQDAGPILLLSPALTAQHSHGAAVGTPDDATASVEPGLGRGLWASAPARGLVRLLGSWQG